jgi:hypothetical protein
MWSYLQLVYFVRTQLCRTCSLEIAYTTVTTNCISMAQLLSCYFDFSQYIQIWEIASVASHRNKQHTADCSSQDSFTATGAKWALLQSIFLFPKTPSQRNGQVGLLQSIFLPLSPMTPSQRIGQVGLLQSILFSPHHHHYSLQASLARSVLRLARS